MTDRRKRLLLTIKLCRWKRVRRGGGMTLTFRKGL